MWKYEYYLQKGIAHYRQGSGCQDRVRIAENDDYLVAALADGLGSLPRSDIAADTATEAVCELLLDPSVAEDLFRDGENDAARRHSLMRAVRSRLEKKAAELQFSPRDMDCTLVFVCVSKRRPLALVGRIGDSAVLVIRPSGSFVINEGSPSANGTNAVLDPDAGEKLAFFRFRIDADRICGFILTSDGLENELYLKGSKHVCKSAERYFNAVSTGKQPKETIVSEIRALTGNIDAPFDDDISIAVLSCVSEPVELEPDPTWLCRCGTRNCMQDTYCRSCGMDFTVLYGSIRFRDYGGKAAYFREINQHPDKERELAGCTDAARSSPVSPKPSGDSARSSLEAASPRCQTPSNTIAVMSQTPVSTPSAAPETPAGPTVPMTGPTAAQPSPPETAPASKTPAASSGAVRKKPTVLPLLLIGTGVLAAGVVIGGLLMKHFLTGNGPDRSLDTIPLSDDLTVDPASEDHGTAEPGIASPDDTGSVQPDSAEPSDTTGGPDESADTVEDPEATAQKPSEEPPLDVPNEDEMLSRFPGIALPYSDAADESYLENIVFLGDSTTYGLKAYAMLKDGKETKQVWTPASGTLMLSRANSTKICYPDTEEEISIAEAASVKRPKIMVITLGVNGISFMNEEQFKDAYTTLIRSIQQSSPDTKIILQSIFPVCKKYDTSGGIDNTKIYRADIWVAEIAQECGCRYLYTASTLTGSDNYLLDSYEGGDGLQLNRNGYCAELAYIRDHPWLD